MNIAYRCALAAVLATTAVACGYSEDVDSSEKHFETPGDDCANHPDDFACGTNSRTFGDHRFLELDSSGVDRNDDGIRYVSVEKPGMTGPLYLEVVKDEITISDHRRTTIRGGKLIGAVLTVARGNERFLIRIIGYGETAYWTGAPRPVPVYTFQWAREPAGGKPPQYNLMCPDTRVSDDGDPQLESHLAVVFSGDHYDVKKKLVSENSRNWFNIGCARSVVSKMHLVQHTTASSDDDHKTTLEERTAMLKMFTDDICGTGDSMTIDGEKVSLMDRQYFRKFDLQEAGTVEAIWSAKGAVCLDEPRRAFEDPDVWERIRVACNGEVPPPCGNVDDWKDRGYGISANPK